MRRLLALCLALFLAAFGAERAFALTPSQEAVLFNGIKPAYVANLLSGTLPSGLLFARASHATQYDNTGALTFAPNNILTQSNTFSNAAFTKGSGSITTGVADPLGGTNASTYTAGAANDQLLQSNSQTLGATTNYIESVWIRRRTGTGTVWFITPSGGGTSVITLSSSWSQVYVKGLGASTTYFGLRLATSGDAVDIFQATFSAVTYETTPRIGDQVVTTSAAYYGPRFDYNPNTRAPNGLLLEGSATNLLLNSKSDGTNLSTQNVTTTAQAYTLSFYGTGTITLSGTSTAGPVVGLGAFPARQILTFTPTAGTLTLTVTGTVQYAQLEANSFASSYIPTGASSVTRAAETATFTGSALTLLQGTRGAAIVQMISEGSTNPTTITNIINGTNSILYRDRTGKLGTTNGTTALLTSGTPTWTSVKRVGLSWRSGNRGLNYTGVAPANDNNSASNGGTIYLGSSNGSASENGWYQSFGLYNRSLSNSVLQLKVSNGAPY